MDLPSLCNCTQLVTNYNFVSTALVVYLDALTVCGCDGDVHNQCTERPAKLTSYHDLAYDKFCNRPKYENICNNPTSVQERQCRQLNSYKRGVDFDDWLIGYSPMCRPYAYGISQDLYQTDPYLVSPYINMPEGCRHLSVLAITIFCLLCVAIIIANFTVLLVVRLDPYFHSPYGYFKASIAVADLLVGIFVVPCLAYTMYRLTYYPSPFRPSGVIPSRILGESEEGFVYAIGLFTILSVAVSVYCLAASSLDRYFSVAQPFRYEAKEFFTKKKSLGVIVGIWLVAFLFASLPIIIPSTTYGQSSASLTLAVLENKKPNGSRPLFPWIELLQAFDNLTFTNNPRLQPIEIPSQDQLSGRHYIGGYADRKMNFTHPPSEIVRTMRTVEALDESGMYVILAIYFLSLILPLICVWVVNILTMRSLRSKKHCAKPSVMINRGRSVSVGGAVSTSTCVSNASSVNSLNLNNGSEEMRGIRSPPPAGQKSFQFLKPACEKSPNMLAVPSFEQAKSRTSNRSMSLQSVLALTSRRKGSGLSMAAAPCSAPSSPTPSRKFAAKFCKDAAIKRMSRVLQRMLIAFTVCVLPAIGGLVAMLLISHRINPLRPKRYSPELKLFQNTFLYLSSVCLFANSFVNCIIYTMLGKRFRDMAKRIYSGHIEKVQRKMEGYSARIRSLKKRRPPQNFTIPKVVEHPV